MDGLDDEFYYIRLFHLVIMSRFVFCLVFIVILHTCDSSLLNPSNRCGINDFECQRKFFQYFGSYYSPRGIPAIGVPILDPYKLYNVTVSFRDVIKVILVEGEAIGIGHCNSTKYVTDIKTKMITSHFTCDTIVIKGNYKLASGHFLKLILGDVINIEGYVVATFEQWSMNATYPIEVEKHEDGDIYIRCLFEEAKYNQTFGNIKVHAENITSGSELTSKMVTDFTNANWKSLITSFGRYFGDKAIEFYYGVHAKFYDSIPAKLFITEDLSSYVDNDDEDEDNEDDDNDEDDEEDEEVDE